MVDMIDPAIMFGPEFIFRAARGRIALIPESFYEFISFAVSLQLEKDFFLQGSDNVDDLFLEPFLMPIREFIVVAGISIKGQNNGNYEKRAHPNLFH
jgi:hypothetical protein